MFQKVDPKTLDLNPFAAIGSQWMLITAGTPDHCNTMTASWGGLGVIWGAPAATCYIRPQRYTKEFVDREDYFTLAFFGEESRKDFTALRLQERPGYQQGKGMRLYRPGGRVRRPLLPGGRAGAGVPQAVRPAHGPRQYSPGN